MGLPPGDVGGVFRSIDSLRDPRAFPGILDAMAEMSPSANKRLKYTKELQLEVEDMSICDSTLTAFEDAEQVHIALDQLPLPQRETLTLFFLSDLSDRRHLASTGVPIRPRNSVRTMPSSTSDNHSQRRQS